MVIQVSFSNKMDTGDTDTLVLTKFFEVDAMPEKSRIIRKLKEIGWRVPSGESVGQNPRSRCRNDAQ
jgi:hypothetical protein